jgi:hypothetical protein
MSTLDDIRKAADTPVITSVDDTTPDGYFAATCKVVGLTTEYLLRGAKDDGAAEIVGRIEIHPADMRCYAYHGGGIKGGQPLFGVRGSEAAFAAMARVAEGDPR